MLSRPLKNFLYLSVSVLCCSCAASFYKPKIESLDSTYEETSNYSMNTPLTAKIGDVMIIKETGYFYKGFRLSGPISYQDKKAFRGQVWMAGHRYEGSCEDGEMVVTGGAFQKAGLGVLINADGEVLCPSPIVSIADNETKGDTFKPEEEMMPTFIPMKGGIPDYEQGAKRTVMMYGGKSDNSIFVFYREFDGNPFFPTKSQDLTFELDESGTFEFDGVGYRVISLKGSTIEFEVPGVKTEQGKEQAIEVETAPELGVQSETPGVEGGLQPAEEQENVGPVEVMQSIEDPSLQDVENMEELSPEDLFPIDPDAKG